MAIKFSDMLQDVIQKTHLPPAVLACWMGVTRRTFQRWLDGDVVPRGVARRLIEFMLDNPTYWRNRIAKIISVTPRKASDE